MKPVIDVVKLQKHLECYHGCSYVLLKLLGLIVIPPGDYPVNRGIKSRTHKLFVALPGNT
jgi:hypothetical protein